MQLSTDVQEKIFQEIDKNRFGSKKELVSELSELLSINKDAVYRRMRGDTLLSITEVYQLSNHFKFSLDKVNDNGKAHLVARYQTYPVFDLDTYLTELNEQLDRHRKLGDFHFYFNAKELPVFYLFYFPDLLAFKCHFWQQTFFKETNTPRKFKSIPLSPDLVKLGNDFLEAYGHVESTEIWGREILNATLKQIIFFVQTDMMDVETANYLIDQLDNLVDVLESQAAIGRKGEQKSPLNIYVNEVLIGDNSVIARNGKTLRTYLSHNIVSRVIIDDESFNNHTFSTFQNIVGKSTLISGTSEISRNYFFKQIRLELNARRKKITALT